MYNPEHKQVILKNSLGVSYHVYYESGRGLCVRMLGDSGIWSRGYVLSDVSVNDFSAILDKDDIFHFVFQAMDGRILYGHGRHGQIEIQPILTSKDTTPWMKHVSLFLDGNQVCFFYMIRYQKRHLLSMQTMRDGVISKPTAIDYTDGPGKSYQAFFDYNGKKHLIYTNHDSHVKRLYHRVMKKEDSIFDAPEKLYSSEQDILLSSAICAKDQIHLLFQVSSNNAYQVFYKKYNAPGEPECLYKSSSPPGWTGLVVSNETLWFFRISNDNIYVRSSEDKGGNWNDEALYPMVSRISLTCFTYFTNYTDERSRFYCDEIPGNFSKGYQLAFLNREPKEEGFTAYSSPLKRNTRPASSQWTDSEKKDGKEQNPIMKELQKKVIQLQNLTGSMQRELTKLWLTQKDYEKKIDQLSRNLEMVKQNSEQIPWDGRQNGTERFTNMESSRGISEKAITQDEDEYPYSEPFDDDETDELLDPGFGEDELYAPMCPYAYAETEAQEADIEETETDEDEAETEIKVANGTEVEMEVGAEA